jgi:hypothetical protein
MFRLTTEGSSCYKNATIQSPTKAFGTASQASLAGGIKTLSPPPVKGTAEAEMEAEAGTH